MPKDDSRSKPRSNEGVFATTHWSVVLSAGKSGSEAAFVALDRLCQTYWYPLFAYVRQRGYPRIAGTNTYADLGAVEGVFNPAMPLLSPVRLGNGTFQFGFTDLSGPAYKVLASTNPALPLHTWLNLGPAVEAPPGTFLFTDPQATNFARRYYRVQGP